MPKTITTKFTRTVEDLVRVTIPDDLEYNPTNKSILCPDEHRQGEFESRACARQVWLSLPVAAERGLVQVEPVFPDRPNG